VHAQKTGSETHTASRRHRSSPFQKVATLFVVAGYTHTYVELWWLWLSFPDLTSLRTIKGSNSSSSEKKKRNPTSGKKEAEMIFISTQVRRLVNATASQSPSPVNVHLCVYVCVCICPRWLACSLALLHCVLSSFPRPPPSLSLLPIPPSPSLSLWGGSFFSLFILPSPLKAPRGFICLASFGPLPTSY
jgi:hypothetical protein